MDLTSPRVIKDIAARFGFTFSKGLGQNFLLDSNVLDKIVEAVQSEGKLRNELSLLQGDGIPSGVLKMIVEGGLVGDHHVCPPLLGLVQNLGGGGHTEGNLAHLFFRVAVLAGIHGGSVQRCSADELLHQFSGCHNNTPFLEKVKAGNRFSVPRHAWLN